MVCLLWFFLGNGLYAANQEWAPPNNNFKYAEVSVAGGLNWYNQHNTHLMISDFETDKVNVHQSTTGASWKIGLGYAGLTETLPYINKLSLDLNLYHTYTALHGTVWQYQEPQFNNYNFRAILNSTRLMLDLKPNLFTWRLMEAYAIFGVGLAWNTVSYQERVTAADVDPDSRLSLSQHTNTQLAWDLGLGCKVSLTKNLSMSLEYIDAILGHGAPAQDAWGIRLAKTPQFLLQSQNFLLGINWSL